MRLAPPLRSAAPLAILPAVLAFFALPAAAQEGCLEILVADPSSAPVSNASVAIGERRQPTDDSGIAVFCGLGAGMHSIVVSAPDFETAEQTVQGSQGVIAVVLQLAVVSEQLVVVGSRAQPRTVAESMAPIDVLPARDLVSQGDTDLSNLLRTAIPSYHVNIQPISDAATIVRPVNLRGMAPDHMLVLVNGKRRHRSAVINWLGNGASDGAQGPDVAVIPAIALRQVEVLRDGAAAQYGSDAIAGVLNFLLKDDPFGGSVEFRTGGYGYGDGFGYTLAANAGLPLGKTGFANLSLEYGNAGATSRTVQRDDAALLAAAGNAHVGDPAQVWGSPEIDNDVKFFGNFGYLFRAGAQIYAHANFARKRVEGGFNFRNPNTRGGVFSLDSGRTLLIGDALDARDGILDGSANCPEVAVTNGTPDRDALDRVFADPNCFSFQELFPGGFTPRFGGVSRDSSWVAGVRGATSGGLNWDAGVGIGAHEADLFIFNTVNASLGPDTPTSFDPGANRQQDVNLNFDLAYRIGRVNLAGGVEWRNEKFITRLGRKESWVVGPFAAQGFSSTSNGFPGYGPLTAGEWDRSNIAVYGDVELESYEQKWTLGAALRFEDFEDFGATTNGKLSGRLRIAGPLALRAGVSSGFRAPTPGQANVVNVSSIYDLELMEIVHDGTIPPSFEAAKLRGSAPLDAEKSVNYTAGAVLGGRRGKGGGAPFTLTADYFRVDMSDRLLLTQRFSLTPEEVDLLLAGGVESARDLLHFRFFANDFSTTTQGVDLVAAYKPPALDGAVFSIAFNRTDTAVTDFSADRLNARRIRELEEAVPTTRWTFTGDHSKGPWRFLGRLYSFGGWWDTEDQLFFNGKTLVDLEISYAVNDSTTIALGAQNLLNTYPDENPFAAARLGNRYSQFTPFGFNGGYYYMCLNYRWSR